MRIDKPQCREGHGPMTYVGDTEDGRQWWACQPTERHPDSCNSGALCDEPVFGAEDAVGAELGADISSAADTPVCPHGHGAMVRRENTSPLAEWMGQWWECAPGPVGKTCTSAVLIPSSDVRAIFEEAK